MIRRHVIKSLAIAASLSVMGVNAYAADTIKVGILHSLSYWASN